MLTFLAESLSSSVCELKCRDDSICDLMFIIFYVNILKIGIKGII